MKTQVAKTHDNNGKNRPKQPAKNSTRVKPGTALTDNRAETALQFKLNTVANQGMHQQASIQLKAIANGSTGHSQSVVQRKLIDPGKSGLNASLVRQYHKAEDDGDAQSVTSNSIEVHETAIDFYKTAKRLRKSAGKLHEDQDGGHLTAIATLDVKISTRRRKIRELKPKATGPAATASTTEERGKPDYSVVMGTANQASWISGVPAWQPR